MFHMLSCFNLKSGVKISEFADQVRELGELLRNLDLLSEVGPIGQRQHHPVMDTDSERSHEYFFTMSFKDRDQCDRAVAHMYDAAGPTDSVHKTVYSNVKDPIFICWQDI